jgi:hypothetical protein
MKTHLISLAVVAVLAGCANPFFDAGRTETVLPLSRAWFDGRVVEYIVTDISDAGMARMMGANHVPRLRDAIGGPSRPALVERVYKFIHNEQISIFQSAPSPAGPDNTDRNYSPLWRVAEVRWLAGATPRELRSEEALLAAQDKGEVSITDTQVVVNCPVTRDAHGTPLKGVR